MISRRSVLTSLAGAALFVGGATAQGDTAFPYGVVFVADSLDGVPFADASHPTLRISSDGKAQGSAGCNRFTGSARIEGSAIQMGQLAMTRMACFGAGAENERLFVPAISTAKAWKMDRRMLVIETEKGALRFRRR